MTTAPDRVVQPTAGPAGVLGGRLRRLVQARHPAFWLHLATLLAGLVLLLYANRLQWFYGDEWDFITNRSLDRPDSLLRPHNEHWSTLPILVYRLLLATVGLHSYLPYILLTVLIHLGVAHLLWRVLRRAGADAWVAWAASGLFVLFGAGAENLLWAFQTTFNGSLLLGFAHLLLVDHEGPPGRRDAAGLGLAVAGLMTSGITITMVAVAGLAVLLRRGLRDALLTVVPPAAVFLVWLATFGRAGLGTHGPADLGAVPAFVAFGLTTTVDTAIGVRGAALVAGVGLAVWLLRHRSELSSRLAAPVACAAGAAVLFTLGGLGRAGMGVELAGSSRYLYVAGALLLPAAGVALSDAAGRGWMTRAAAVVLLSALALRGGLLLRTHMVTEAAREQELRSIIEAAADLDVERVLAHEPEPRFTPDLQLADLRALEAAGRLPDRGPPEPDARLSALLALRSSFTAEPLFAAAAGTQPEAPAGTAASTCTLLEPGGTAVAVPLTGPASLGLDPLPDGMEAFLQGPGGAVSSAPRSAPPAAASARWLNVDVRGTLTLQVPPVGSPVRVCGLPTGG